MKYSFIAVLFICCLPAQLFGQESSIYSYDEFIQQVKEYYPLIRQLDLYEQKSKAYIKKAKGEFDPKINLNVDQKSFDQKNYFQKYEGKLKIPVWYGIDIESGYENFNGSFLNAENTVPEDGLIYAGVKVPLGQGLFYNDRQKILEESRIIEFQNELDQKEKYNEILLKASQSYIKWQVLSEKLTLYRRMLSIAKERFENVKLLYQKGANPAIDTLEAKLIVENRNLNVFKTEEKLIEAKLALSLFLWSENLLPLELSENVNPEKINISNYDNTIDRIVLDQENLIKGTTKFQSLLNENRGLIIEEKLLKEGLKPILNVRLNPLLSLANNGINYNQNDYKIGAEFAYPLLNRKTKGKLELIRIEQQENKFDQILTNQEIHIAIDQNINAQLFIESRHDIAQNNALIADELLSAENEKFNIGESSIFLINAREQKKIDFETKILDLKMELILKQLELIGISQQF